MPRRELDSDTPNFGQPTEGLEPVEDDQFQGAKEDLETHRSAMELDHLMGSVRLKHLEGSIRYKLLELIQGTLTLEQLIATAITVDDLLAQHIEVQSLDVVSLDVVEDLDVGGDLTTVNFTATGASTVHDLTVTGEVIGIDSTLEVLDYEMELDPEGSIESDWSDSTTIATPAISWAGLGSVQNKVELSHQFLRSVEGRPGGTAGPDAEMCSAYLHQGELFIEKRSAGTFGFGFHTRWRIYTTENNLRAERVRFNEDGEVTATNDYNLAG